MSASVYEQLKKWQEIPHARREWGKYRGELADFIVANTRHKKTAAILGAGSCDDMDLARLSRHFQKLILVDADRVALQKACRGYDTADCEIKLQEHDFLGISPADYEDYSDALQQGIRLRGKHTDIGELAELAQRKLEGLYARAWEKPLEIVTGDCDYLVAVGVHSQLNMMASFIWNAYEQALGQRAPQMYLFFAEKNDAFIRRFDEKIVETAGIGVIYGFETKRLGIPGSVQGAAQGLSNEARIEAEGRLVRKASEKLLWNFDIAQGIAYEMEVIACEVCGVDAL